MPTDAPPPEKRTKDWQPRWAQSPWLTYSAAGRWDGLSSHEFYKLPQWEQSRIVAEYLIDNRIKAIEMHEARQTPPEDIGSGN